MGTSCLTFARGKPSPSGDYIDMKMYEPAMRHLLDTYIRAEDSEKLSAFDDLTLVDLIVERGEAAVDSLPGGIRDDHEVVAETIENNVRRRKQEAMDYKAYLARLVELTKRVRRPETQASYPSRIDSAALRALFDNLEEVRVPAVVDPQVRYGTETSTDTRVEKALALDHAIRSVKKADWRGNRFKQREVRNAIRSELGDNDALVDTFFEIVKNQRDY